jgi:hypothetical protein
VRGRSRWTIALAAILAVAMGTGVAGAVSSDKSFNSMVEAAGAALQLSTGNVYVYDDQFAPAHVHVFDSAGTPVTTFSLPGSGGNDADIDFIDENTTIEGTAVPAGSLLYGSGDNNEIYVLDPAGTTLLGPLAIPATNGSGDVDGIAYDTARNSIWIAHFSTDVVDELALSDLHIVQSFPMAPTGSPAWDMFFGDVDVNASNGYLYLNSSSQATMRVLRPNGTFVLDIDLSAILGANAMGGLALDDVHAGQAWVSTLSGTVYHLLAVPTAVELVSFTARRAGHAVALTWRTASDARILGFRLSRIGRDGRGQRLNATLITARAGGTYRFVDRNPVPGTDRYRLAAFRLDGTRAWVATATAAP